jgi:glycine cleavage system H protein
MNIPEGLFFTDTHEWLRIEGDVGIVGITNFAQNELGDVVFVELPDEGDDVQAGDVFGEVESTKAVSDLKSPISGEVIESNDNEEDYSVINSDPFGAGWLLKIKMSDQSEISKLMDNAGYKKMIG